MHTNNRSYLRKLALSLGASGFSILLVCLLLGWHAVVEIAALNSVQSADKETLSLWSKAIEPGSSVLGNLSPTAVLIVAGLLAALVIANALSEANNDSFLGEVKRQFGSVYVEHLFLPVAIKTSENQLSSSFLVRLDKHYATFLATQPIAVGTKVSFYTDLESGRTSTEQQQFHGAVSLASKDEASSFFEIEVHLHAKNEVEKTNLTNWITSLRPSAIAT